MAAVDEGSALGCWWGLAEQQCPQYCSDGTLAVSIYGARPCPTPSKGRAERLIGDGDVGEQNLDIARRIQTQALEQPRDAEQADVRFGHLHTSRRRGPTGNPWRVRYSRITFRLCNSMLCPA